MSIWDYIPGGSMIDSFLHPERGYKEAENERRKYWEESQGYGRPYWQQGLDQYGRLSGAQDRLLDPTALLDEWMKHYQTSPYAQQSLKESEAQGMDAASRMGLTGSSAATENIQQKAGDIMQKDRQAYLEDLMNKYMAGVGIGSNIYNQGAQTGRSLSEQAGNVGRDMAGLKYGETNAPGNVLENMMKMFAQAASAAGGAGGAGLRGAAF